MALDWTVQTERAAELIAEGRLTTAEIAEQVGVSRMTLWRLEQDPEFAARVDEIVEAYRAESLRHGIARRDRRIAALNDRWRRMQRVLDERAAAPEMADVPGGTTGLLVREIKIVGRGEAAREVETFTFDAALVREMREHEKQVAIELGQWLEKSQVSGGVQVTVDAKLEQAALDAVIKALSDSELDSLQGVLSKMEQQIDAGKALARLPGVAS